MHCNHAALQIQHVFHIPLQHNTLGSQKAQQEDAEMGADQTGSPVPSFQGCYSQGQNRAQMANFPPYQELLGCLVQLFAILSAWHKTGHMEIFFPLWLPDRPFKTAE